MLQMKYKNSEKRPLWLVDAKYTIGRATGCDIQVQDPRVAAQQAELLVTSDEVELINLGEPEAVSVNGESVSQAIKLAHGDELAIGSQSFELMDPKLVRATADTEQLEAVEEQGVSGWSLKASNTALANKSFPIDRDVVVGRSNECDITLGVAHLSRRHARLFFSGGQLEVEDLRSSNGTQVNGQRVQRSLLRDGDELSLDTLTFKVIGPVGENSDSTMLRPQKDIDKTNLRPVINVDEKKTPEVSKPLRSESAAKASSLSRETQQIVDDDYEEESAKSKVGAIIIAVVVLGIIAAGYWLFVV